MKLYVQSNVCLFILHSTYRLSYSKMRPPRCIYRLHNERKTTRQCKTFIVPLSTQLQ